MSYYLSKGFETLAQDYQALKNIPTNFKQLIHAVDMHEKDLVMNRNMEIPSVANTQKKIYLSITTFNEITSTCHDDKNCGFEILFKQFTENSVDNIEHPALIK